MAVSKRCVIRSLLDYQSSQAGEGGVGFLAFGGDEVEEFGGGCGCLLRIFGLG